MLCQDKLLRLNIFYFEKKKKKVIVRYKGNYSSLRPLCQMT